DLDRVVRGHDHVVLAGTTGLQLGQEFLVAGVGVHDHPDAVLRLEVGQDVLGHVLGPDEQVQDLLFIRQIAGRALPPGRRGLASPAAGREHQHDQDHDQRRAGAPPHQSSHTVSPYPARSTYGVERTSVVVPAPSDLLRLTRSDTQTKPSVATSMRVDSALILGLTPNLTMENTCRGRVVEPGPAVKNVMMKSSIDTVRARRAPAATPGSTSGSVTRRKVVHSSAPRSIAARSRLGSRPCRRARTTRATKGVQKVTWARITVRSHGLNAGRRKVARRLIPRTISRSTSGTYSRPPSTRRPGKR